MSGADTRESIRAAAAPLFAERGYGAVSVREIAAAAGYDPALVIRHFGSKEALFLATIDAGLPQEVPLDGPIDDLGVRFVRFVLDPAHTVRQVFLGLLRASDAEEVGLRLRTVHERFFVAPLRARLAGDDADLRARLAGAMVGGLLYALWVAEDEELARRDPEDVAREYGALLQRLITP
jgi:AcrR family transcriptional regulator